MKKNKIFSLFASFFLILALSGCESLSFLKSNKTTEPQAPKNPVYLRRTLLGPGFLTASELHDFFMSQNPDADSEMVMRLAKYYIIESSYEYINYSAAFAQMCLETGYLRFGNLVTPEMHNYCGLGAMDAAHPGAVFETEQMGVRAHIQHLQAYATTEDVPLHQELIDPRYSWVHKTKYVETIDGLAGTWATDPEYGNKLEAILLKMEIFVNGPDFKIQEALPAEDSDKAPDSEQLSE